MNVLKVAMELTINIKNVYNAGGKHVVMMWFVVGCFSDIFATCARGWD